MTLPVFEVLIIPVIWCAKEELRLGEIKQLVQGLIAGWPCVNLNSALFNGFAGGSAIKVSASNAGAQVQSLDQEDPLEKGMATHSSILAWKIPWREEPGRLQSTGS